MAPFAIPRDGVETGVTELARDETVELEAESIIFEEFDPESANSRRLCTAEEGS